MSDYYCLVAKNKKAYHDYLILDKFEAGIELLGTEVKSIRNGGADLKGSYVVLKDEEAFVVDMHISPYERAGRFNHKTTRRRKLLLHKQEIRRLQSKVNEKGFTLIPLTIFFRGDWVKVEIGLARGKALYDKRESMKKKDANREMSRLRKHIS